MDKSTLKMYKATIPKLDPDEELYTILFAETASKARYKYWIDISDYYELEIMDIRILRYNPEVKEAISG